MELCFESEHSEEELDIVAELKSQGEAEAGKEAVAEGEA